jgi:DNA-binding MarR family transcriptional regulator
MAELDKVIHEPARLRVMAVLVTLARREQVDFVCLRDLLKLTDGNLGAHLIKLEDAGYVKIVKTYAGKKPCTYLLATGKGRDAFEEHVEALRKILKGTEGGDARRTV